MRSIPVLTPLAVDPGHPFPYISTLSLSIAVGLRDPATGERGFARVKVPQILPRLLEVEKSRFVLLDQVIEANLDALFSGMEVLEHHLFRVTRNADLAIEEDEADDLLLAIEEELRRRRFGEAVRLEVERSMPAATRTLLMRGLGLEEDDSYEISGMLDLTGLWAIADLDRPDLQGPGLDAGHAAPAHPAGRGRTGRCLRRDPRRRHPGPSPVRVVHGVRRAVHHPGRGRSGRPHDQADAVPDVRRFAAGPVARSVRRSAASRSSSWSRSRPASTRRRTSSGRASWSGPARTSSTDWSGSRPTAKTALVVRREGSGLRRYVHIGTGNYNPKTARLYVDLGLLTCRPEIGADVTDLFNVLTGLSRQQSFRRLLVAPHSLRSRFLELVDREMAHAAGRPAMPGSCSSSTPSWMSPSSKRSIGPRTPASTSTSSCAARAPSSRACPGVSERIRVRSIVGEFLEHSRIWSFENDGSREWYIGSADLMDRNLDRRVEAVVPVEDHEAGARAWPGSST